MKAWECSACGGKSFTRLNENTIMCDYCETRFTLEEEPKKSAASSELQRARIAALVAQSVTLHEKQEYQEEIGVLLQALELDEENSDVWTKLGRAYRLLGMHDDAVRCYEKAIKIDPFNGAAYGNIGVVYTLKGDYANAIRCLKHGMTLCDQSSTDYAVLMANLALATYYNGDKAEGIRLLSEAERRGYKNGAAVREKMGIAQAAPAQAASAQPSTAQDRIKAASLKLQAQKHYEKEEYAQAVSLLQQAVQLDSGNSEIWTQLGRAHRLTNNPDEALRCYQRALQLDPNNGPAYGNIGVLYHQRGEYQQAIRHYSKALNMLPANSGDRATMTANLAMSTYLSGDRQNGERLLSEAEKLGYKNGAAARKQMGMTSSVSRENRIKAEALREKAQNIYKEKQYAQALLLLQEAIELNPEDSFLWTSLGRAYNVNGEPDEALRCHQRALELDPNNGAAHGNIGLIWHNKGNHREAIRCYRKALSLLPSNEPDHWTMKANLAISTYLSGDKKNGIRLLDEAEKLGYRNAANVRKQFGIPKGGLFGGLFK